MVMQGEILYVYRCRACAHAGQTKLSSDSHDGEAANYDVCGALVTLEWDGGVTFDARERA